MERISMTSILINVLFASNKHFLETLQITNKLDNEILIVTVTCWSNMTRLLIKIRTYGKIFSLPTHEKEKSQEE